MLCCVYCLVDETDMMENPPFFFFPADRVCGSDCRSLWENDISELASGLFDNLINLEKLCVALNAAALPLANCTRNFTYAVLRVWRGVAFDWCVPSLLQCADKVTLPYLPAARMMVLCVLLMTLWVMADMQTRLPSAPALHCGLGIRTAGLF